MFQPYKLPHPRPQKRRSYRSGTGVFSSWERSPFRHWPRLIALGPGSLTDTLVERLVIIGKRNLNPLVTLRRFWVNIQVASVLTRKPVNVRMGKGKGGRRAIQAKVWEGTTLAGYAAIRPGLLQALRRRVQVRCSFGVGVCTTPASWAAAGATGTLGAVITWIADRRIQPRYLTNRLRQFQEELRPMRRPLMWSYILTLYGWQRAIPYAIWSPASRYRWRFRVRQRRAYKRRLLSLARPQGLGFLRQLRSRVRTDRWKLWVFKGNGWARHRKRWRSSVWSPRRLQLSPYLPWDILLRARQRKRLVPHLHYGSLYGPAAADGTTTTVVAGRLFRMSGFNERLGLTARWPAMWRLHRLLLAQLTTLVLFWHWIRMIGHPASFAWVNGRKAWMR